MKQIWLNSFRFLIAFSRGFAHVDGQITVFFVMTVAAAEAAVGLALIVLFYRRRDTVNIDEANILKW